MAIDEETHEELLERMERLKESFARRAERFRELADEVWAPLREEEAQKRRAAFRVVQGGEDA